MKRKHGTMYVSTNQAAVLTAFCNTPPGWDNSDGETCLFDKEYTFDDGMRMAIQVCPSTDPSEESCWTQGVLFDPAGNECGCTDCGESFLGEYGWIECDGAEYTVTVKVGSKAQVRNQPNVH